ncbi:MAG: 30S ribosomal protein S12 methylthiotransferase RimO [Deltaproteobacteria bacterium]|nr:30S ribosomal protein S12 methylthiotransferase RimO [Deltaproteobacteria bacterium]MBW2662053.1 30S ribosomal protein S12 methylthiotransferase RimO [Deltaproteobacteria bacterium]
MKVYLINLGCVRNLVDSELMLGRLVQAGWTITQKPEEANIIVVNTCSFIEPAVNESIDTILELAKLKETGRCRNIIVTGCLPERFREEIVHLLPEVDFFLGTGAFDKIIQAANSFKDLPVCFLPDPNFSVIHEKHAPRKSDLTHMAYIKIAEGCDKGCTYCIIPKLRGKHRSRSLEDIVSEARSLISSGVKELILVAQDTTYYGRDLCPPVDLGMLIEKISVISEKAWVRFLYGHPESINESVIKAVADHSNICPYFDIPIQHVSGSILKRMGRKYTRDYLYRLIDKIRSLVPDAALRTTVIVGFPGETEKDFRGLLDFAEDICFDHLGAFIYSDFEDLPSHRFSGHIPEKVATQRYDLLMSNQAKISLKNNSKQIGRTVKVLVEEKQEDNIFCGRTAFQAPEVDGIIYINSGQIKTGCFADIKITDAYEYDLVGEPA